ncbi:DUF6152 family protein [Salinarimonas soli]|uniref:Uncharacterized protein n=1 Tax=Salinarimonas soli TaxID=1638099 RepID=A0A5B2W139_9HYPH|nr:DUF6152 family protein [Salinarimonas soli]KAA2244206.1 hypothetical protein F0L46_00730 [Salinarimonas soli]
MTARLALCTIIAVLGAGGALAHHGWGSYDAAKTLRITAPVESLQWQNPHVHVMIPHEGKTWEAVLAPPFRMNARGLEPEAIKAGTPVTVEGYASTKVPTELRAERIIVDGKTFELR